MIRITKTTKAPKGLMVINSSNHITPALCLQVFENGTVVPVGSNGDVWTTKASFYWRRTNHIDYRDSRAKQYVTLYAMPQRLALQKAYDAMDKHMEEKPTWDQWQSWSALERAQTSFESWESEWRSSKAEYQSDICDAKQARDAALEAL